MPAKEETIYQEYWDKNRRNNSLGCIGFVVLVAALVIFGIFFPNPWASWIAIVLAVPIAIWFFFWAWLADWNSQPICPRCKEFFSIDGVSKLSDFERDKCRSCGLPIYYGSEWFWDHWGTERGKLLVREVEEKENYLDENSH